MPRREPKYPQLLIVKEKHTTYYFHIGSREELHSVSLEILKRRDEEGYWYPEKSLEYTTALRDIESALRDYQAGGKGPGFTVYDTLAAKLPYAKRNARFEQESNKQRDEITSALVAHDGEMAFAVLEARADHEYEGFELETYSNT